MPVQRTELNPYPSKNQSAAVSKDGNHLNRKVFKIYPNGKLEIIFGGGYIVEGSLSPSS